MGSSHIVLNTFLVFSSEIGILTSTALLHRIVRQVTSEVLVHEMVCFILGEQREPETPIDINRHPLRHRLIEHCDHISDEVRNYRCFPKCHRQCRHISKQLSLDLY